MMTKRPAPHLTARTRSLLRASPQTRISWACRHRLVEYPERREARKLLLEALYPRSPDAPARTIMLGGPAGNGREALLRGIMAEHGHPFADEAAMSLGQEARASRVVRPIVWPTIPECNTIECIADHILGCCNLTWPDSKERDHGYLMKALGTWRATRLVVFLDLWDRPGRAIRNLLTRITTETGASIVLAETRTRKETDNWARAAPDRAAIHFPPWTPGPKLKTLLENLEREIPLPEPSQLGDLSTMRWITDEGRGTLGGIIKVVQNAASLAVQLGRPRIEECHLVADPLTGQRAGQ